MYPSLKIGAFFALAFTATVCAQTAVTPIKNAKLTGTLDLSGVSNKITIRYDLGLEIGVNVQPYNSATLVNPMAAVGDTIYGGASGVATRLAGPTAASQYVQTWTGTGSAAQAPVFTTVASILAAAGFPHGSTTSAGSFSTLSAAGAVTLSPTTGNVTLSPLTGTVVMTTTGSSGIQITPNGNLTLSPAVGSVSMVTSGSGAITITSAGAGALSNFSLNGITLSGTGGSTLNVGTGGTLGTAAYTASSSYQGALTNSAGLRGALSDETGSGLAVFGTSPNITTPTGIVKGDVGLGNVDNISNAVERAAVRSLTNARLVPRVATPAYNSSITPDSDSYDKYVIGTLTGTITINAPAGAPTPEQNLEFKFTQNATGFAITLASGAGAFKYGTDVTAAMIPTTANARFKILTSWDATDGKWWVTAITRGF